MRPLILLIAIAAVLSAAGLALAGRFGTSAVSSTSATFTATPASSIRTSSCTNADGTFVDTRGTYTGTATSSDPALNGPIRIVAHSLLNTTKKLGTVSGTLRIDLSGRPNTFATFQTVYSGGSIAGLATGRTRSPSTRLLANLSAAFSATGGFTGAKLGGSTGGGAVELSSGRCRPAAATRARIDARGNVTAISSTSITVAGVTCAIPSGLQAAVARRHIAVGNRVQVRCSVENGTTTLTRLSVRRRDR